MHDGNVGEVEFSTLNRLPLMMVEIPNYEGKNQRFCRVTCKTQFFFSFICGKISALALSVTVITNEANECRSYRSRNTPKHYTYG